MSNSMPYATIMIGDVFEQMALIPDNSVDCCVTSPPYWGLRDYGYEGQIGLEPTLGEHLDVMVRVFEEIRRILKPMGTCWINYGDCYATKPNGRSAADTKRLSDDDRTFRDKPFSTIGPIRVDRSENLGNKAGDGVRRNTTGPVYAANYTDKPRGTTRVSDGEQRFVTRREQTGRVVAGGYLKEKDLCMIPNRLAIALQDAGWWVRAENIWGKPNPMPDSSGKYRPSTAHEKVWLLTKSAKSYYDSLSVKMPVSGGTNARVRVHTEQDGFDMGEAPIERAVYVQQNPKAAPANSGVKANVSFQAATTAVLPDRYLRNYEPDLTVLAPLGVMHIATAAYADAHFATFPPALVVPCILAGCPAGGLVIDPFGGAGTTSLVAQGLKRNSIMIEMSEEYAAMARRRIDNGNIGFGLEAAE